MGKVNKNKIWKNLIPKTIVFDEGVLSMRSIMNWGSVKKKILDGKLPENTFLPPVSYTFFLLIISTLKKIGVNKDDIIIIARDKSKSYLKFFYPNYKAQRKGFRDEKEHINFPYHWKIIDKFLEQINESTNFHVLHKPFCWNGADLLFTPEGQKFIKGTDYDKDLLSYNYGLEADHWIACASKYYSDREVVFVSIDCDLDMLCVRPNTKYFTLTQKVKGSSGMYKAVENGYKVLAGKIEKGDVSDNIIPGTTDDGDERARQLREFIIDLINLPEWVEKECFEVFENLPQKEVKPELLPFQNSLAKKFFDIYKKDKVISYNYCKQLLAKRNEKRKKKTREKAKAKREQKKKEKLRRK